MDYPIWNVAVGGGVLIGAIAILHVLVSHFAVGGGIVMAALEVLLVRRPDPALRALLKRSSLMLILVSTVFGALSGVGIWFVIGLVQPAATRPSSILSSGDGRSSGPSFSSRSSPRCRARPSEAIHAPIVPEGHVLDVR